MILQDVNLKLFFCAAQVILMIIKLNYYYTAYSQVDPPSSVLTHFPPG